MRKVLYTCANSATPWWFSTTKAFVEAYCQKYGIELINLPEPVGYQPQWVIFDAFRESLKLPEGSQAAWIDSDIVIHDDAPNIFDTEDKLFFCPPDPYGFVPTKMLNTAQRNKMIHPRPYLVSGVVKWSQRHVVKILQWFDDNNQYHPNVYGDQELLALAAYTTETYFTYFPASWHRAYGNAHKACRGFLHAGGNNKAMKLRRLTTLVDERRALIASGAIHKKEATPNV
jgi:hypothetical protein